MTRPAIALAAAAVAAAIALPIALAGCGGEAAAGTATTPSRAATGAGTPAPDAAAVIASTQTGRYGPYDLMRCTGTGTDGCDAPNGSRGAVRQMQVANGYLFAGSFNGDVLRCNPAQPVGCDAIDKVPGITALALGADTVWLGTNEGALVRCPQTTANAQCTVMHQTDDFVRSLAMAGTRLYVALDNGQLLSCATQGTAAGTCTTRADLGAPVMSVTTGDPSRVVAGTGDGRVVSCALHGTERCNTVTSLPGAQAHAVAVAGGVVYAGFGADDPTTGGQVGTARRCTAPGTCDDYVLPTPTDDTPPAAAVTAIVPTSAGVWIAQGRVSPSRGNGQLSRCDLATGTACQAAWADETTGVLALAAEPA